MCYRNGYPLILFYQSQGQSPPGPSIPDGDGPRQQSDSALIKTEPLVDHLFPDQQLQDPKL